MLPGMKAVPSRSFVRWVLTLVYVVSPLLAVVDFGFGWNLRIPLLDGQPGWKVVYYLAMTGLGLTMLWVPVLTAPLSIVECGINVALTCLMVALPYVELLESARTGGETELTNFPMKAVLVNGIILSIAAMSIRFRNAKRAT